MTKNQRIRQAIKKAFRFNSLGAANSFSLGTIKATAVMLGDDGLFWVVTLADMERLTHAGYEIAE